MDTNHVKSTVFKVDDGLSKTAEERKLEQERLVGKMFQAAYLEETGIALAGNRRPKSRRPDRMFTWQGKTLGAEMVELDSFYEIRAFADALTNAVYAEFAKLGSTDHYLGLAARLLGQWTSTWKESVYQQWTDRDIRKSHVQKFAREFVHLFRTAVASRADVPAGIPGRRIMVDPATYPALAAVGDRVLISRTVDETLFRSDGRTAPLVAIGPGWSYTDEEREATIEAQIRKKMALRSKWPRRVDRAVLIAHDLPREHMYDATIMRWRDWVETVVQRVDVLQNFDEVWLVTWQDLRGQAERIAGSAWGRDPGGPHGPGATTREGKATFMRAWRGISSPRSDWWGGEIPRSARNDRTRQRKRGTR